MWLVLIVLAVGFTVVLSLHLNAHETGLVFDAIDFTQYAFDKLVSMEFSCFFSSFSHLIGIHIFFFHCERHNTTQHTDQLNNRENKKWIVSHQQHGQFHYSVEPFHILFCWCRCCCFKMFNATTYALRIYGFNCLTVWTLNISFTSNSNHKSSLSCFHCNNFYYLFLSV